MLRNKTATVDEYLLNKRLQRDYGLSDDAINEMNYQEKKKELSNLSKIEFERVLFRDIVE